jgi:hypothetical protein
MSDKITRANRRAASSVLMDLTARSILTIRQNKRRA